MEAKIYELVNEPPRTRDPIRLVRMVNEIRPHDNGGRMDFMWGRLVGTAWMRLGRFDGRIFHTIQSSWKGTRCLARYSALILKNHTLPLRIGVCTSPSSSVNEPMMWPSGVTSRQPPTA